MVSPVDLALLTTVRDQYEGTFASLPGYTRATIERLSAHDLELSGHVVWATSRERRLQITLDADATPCAFFKRTGVDLEILLLHIVTTPADLRIDACRDMFDAWLVSRLSDAAVEVMASKFGS